MTAPRATRPYSRHGLNALKVRVKVRGLNAIDRRTNEARGLLRRRGGLIASLGGEANVSVQQLAVIDIIIRTMLYVDSLDAWLMGQPSLVNARRRTVLPVLLQRQQMADSLVRHLQTLGLGLGKVARDMGMIPASPHAAAVGELEREDVHVSATPDQGADNAGGAVD